MQLLLAILAVVLSVATSLTLLISSDVLLLPEPLPQEEHASFASVSKENLEVPKFWSFRSREIETLVSSLNERQKQIANRENENKQVEGIVQSEKKELESSKAEIQAIREKLLAHIIVIEKSEEKNLIELANTYTNLPPESVVEVFKSMDDVFVIKIISHMETEVVASIFQSMISSAGNATERVARLTQLMRLRERS